MRTICFALLITLITASSFAQLSADDFLPPIQATSPEEREKLERVDGIVTTVTDEISGYSAIQAGNIQSAINYIVSQRNVGTQMIKFGSGWGWVSTGVSSYQIADNPTATRQSKRNAYVKAFLSAKSSLAEALNGLNVAGRTQVLESMETITDAHSDISSYESSLEDRLEQSVQMLLKGFVTYSVEDVPDDKTVYVSIVTTPKTRGKFNRPAHNMIQARTLRDGLTQVFSEIQNNIIPPVGGKMIAVGETGEMAFVGFGSAIVAINKNPALQAKLRLEAQKIADMRASDALVGMLIGDDSSWKRKLDSSQVSLIQDFERSDARNDKEVQRLEQSREVFLSTTLSTTEMQSIRNGILPPGIQRRSFNSEDNAEVYSVAVYIPSVTDQARQAAKEMEDTQLIQKQAPSSSQRGSSIFTNPETVQQPSSTVLPGPTGVISPEKEL
jgi:hypothetical protein